MATQRPTTIAEYIQAAPPEGQPHLRRLYAILKSVAPEAGEAIKWGTPFFVDPRFLNIMKWGHHGDRLEVRKLRS